MNNPVGSFLMSQEEQTAIARIERLKRLGRNFLHVRYIGSYLTQVPRLHGLQGIEAYQVRSPETGRMEWHTREGAEVLTFNMGPTGDMIADVWDTEYNRFWVARQLGVNLEIDDPKVRKDILALADMPYKVELNRKEELVRQRQKIEEELARMDLEIEQEGEAVEDPPEYDTIAKDVERGLQSQPAPEQPAATARKKGGRPKGKRRDASDKLNAEETVAQTESA